MIHPDGSMLPSAPPLAPFPTPAGPHDRAGRVINVAARVEEAAAATRKARQKHTAETEEGAREKDAAANGSAVMHSFHLTSTRTAMLNVAPRTLHDARAHEPRYEHADTKAARGLFDHTMLTSSWIRGQLRHRRALVS